MRPITAAAILGILAAPSFAVASFAQVAPATRAAPAALPAPAAVPTPAPAAGEAAVGGLPSDAAGKRAMERVEKHITELRTRLALTSAQQPQWDAFARVMRDNARHMEASYNERHAKMSAMSAVDDMRGYAAMARAHAEDVGRLVPAFEALYQSMTPEQRVAADKTFQNFQRGDRRMNHRS